VPYCQHTQRYRYINYAILIDDIVFRVVKVGGVRNWKNIHDNSACETYICFPISIDRSIDRFVVLFIYLLIWLNSTKYLSLLFVWLMSFFLFTEPQGLNSILYIDQTNPDVLFIDPRNKTVKNMWNDTAAVYWTHRWWWETIILAFSLSFACSFQ